MGLITLQVSIQTVLDKFFFVTFGSHGTQFERLLLKSCNVPEIYRLVSQLLADLTEQSVCCAVFQKNCLLLANDKTDSE